MTADAVQAGSLEPRADRVLRISGLQLEGALTRCTTDGGDIMVPRVPATYLRTGDDIRVGPLNSPANEYLAIQNSLRRKARQLYFGRIGYVTQPRADKRDEYFVRAEVPESGFGIRALHLPSTVVRDYFYFFAQASSGAGCLTLYELLRASPKASPADLRLSYRIRRIELDTMNAGASELQRADHRHGDSGPAAASFHDDQHPRRKLSSEGSPAGWALTPSRGSATAAALAAGECRWRPEQSWKAGGFVMSFLRHDEIYRSDVG